jgi:type II secretory pathway component PulF
MEDAALSARLDALEKKVEATLASAEKTRKILLAGAIVSVIAFILPLFGLVFVIPSFLSSYSQLGNL